MRRQISVHVGLALALAGSLASGVGASAAGAAPRVVRLNTHPYLVAEDAARGHIFVIGRTDVAAAAASQRAVTVDMLDAATGRPLHTAVFPQLYDTPESVTVSTRAGRIYLVTRGEPGVGIVDTATGAVLGMGAIGTPVAAAPGTFVSDSDFGPLAVDDPRGRIFVLSQRSTTSQAGGASPVDHQANSVSVLDAASGKVVHTLALGARDLPAAVAVDPQTGRAFVANRRSNTVAIIDGAGGSIIGTVGLGTQASPCAGAIDGPAGRVLFLNGSVTSSVSVLDLRDGHLLRAVPLGITASRPCGIAVDERTGHAFVPGTNAAGASLVAILSIPDGRLLRTVAVGSGSGSIIVDGHRGRVLVASAGGLVATRTGLVPRYDGSVTVLDSASGGILRTVAVRGNPNDIGVDANSGQAFAIALDLPGSGALPIAGHPSGGVIEIDDRQL